MAGYELNYEALDDADKKKEVTAAEEFIDWVELVRSGKVRRDRKSVV